MLRVDWVKDREVKAMLETVDIGNTTEESVRLGFCPGNVRTGRDIPKIAH